jgi:hypothetical protein
MDLLLAWLKDFNSNYAGAMQAMTPVVIGVVSWFYYSVYREAQTRSDKTIYVGPSFWSLRAKHRIDTVKRFELTPDRKNYVELETLYTPQSWSQHIFIQRACFKTTVSANDPAAILIVTLKRKPHENWKLIHINR